MDASDNKSGIYTFAGFTLDASKRLVFDSRGEPLPLMPKAYEILFFLVTNSQRVIEKDELMSSIWPDTIVEENNLTQNISAVRRALGEKHRENRFIATVPGRGYKFVAEVTAADSPSLAETSGETRPAHSANSRIPHAWLIAIAFLVFGGLIVVGLMGWQARSTASTDEIRSVAVLPFKPLTSDRRDESLELGMADTLIMKLGSDDRVAVRPLSSVRRFSSLDQDPVEAGRAVGVDAVLEGNTQIANERIRVSVRLLRVSDARQLWSGQFDEKLTDIFQVQDSIAQRVANALNISLATGAKNTFTASVEAYRLYLRGNLHARRLIRSEVEKGIVYYEDALKLDPNFALAYVDMAHAYRSLVLTSDLPPSEIMPKAKEAASKALALDNTLAEAWAARAFIAFWYDWDWRSAEADHIRALELDPHSVQSRISYAHFLSNLGRNGEALEQARIARERDPVGLITNAIEGLVLSSAGRHEAAATSLNNTIDMGPDFWLAHLFISSLYLRTGEYDLAVNSARRAADLSGGNAEALSTVGYALARLGKSEEARKVLSELQDRSKTRHVPAHALAQIYAGLDDRHTALDLLEKAYSEKDANMVFLKVDPKWDSLRSEPRFMDLMRRMNFD